jgi:hypothetical protein
VTDLAVIAQPNALDEYADPAVTVVLACERAKEWLAMAGREHDIEDIVNVKAQAEAIRVYTTTKQLGRDAELAATEIIRRAERCIGLAIRKGQEEGTINRPGLRKDLQASLYNKSLPSPHEFATSTELSGNDAGIYHMTDGVTDEQFEQALAEAKVEQNLSRANVVRKAKGEPSSPTESRAARVDRIRALAADGWHSRQISKEVGLAAETVKRIAVANGIELPGDVALGRTRRIRPEEVVERVIVSLEAAADSLAVIGDIRSLDAEKRLEWLEALRQPLAAINRFKKELSS